MAVIAKSRRPDGWYIPWLFVAFFVVVIAANGIMMYFAFSSWTGLETKDHFRRGIQYNRDLEAARAQDERGWNVGFDFKPSGAQAGMGRQGDVDVVLKDKFGNTLLNAQVIVQFLRPTAEGHDLAVELPYRGDGHYAAAVEIPLVGVWDMHVTVLHASGDYQKTKRVLVKE